MMSTLELMDFLYVPGLRAFATAISDVAVDEVDEGCNPH